MMSRTIHCINAIIFTINVLLYCSPALGMYFQLVLGPIQLLIALGFTFNIAKFTIHLRTLLIIYWVLAAADLTALALLMNYGNIDILYMGLINFVAFPVAMCIAAYFVFVTYKIQKLIR